MRMSIQHQSFGLLGCPLSHSLSPLIHSALFSRSGVRGAYTLFEQSDSELKHFMAEVAPQLNGFNVTRPHKRSVIPYLDSLSAHAALFGAVNTVAVREDGSLVGHNTDGSGFLRALNMADISLEGNVLVCGCGGVSRVFGFESGLAGATVTLAVREHSRPAAALLREEIEHKLGQTCAVIALDEAERFCWDLILNGTPVGMAPYTDASPVSERAVARAGAVFDAVYYPYATRLMQYAQKNGVRHINGLPMLVWQAASAQEVWCGTNFCQEDIVDIMAQCERELTHE